MSTGWIILIVVGVLIFWIVSIYNKIIRLKENVVNAEKQISVQLDRRAKIFDSLINSVKKYMDYEKSAFKEVVELRQKAINLEGDAFNNEELKEVEESLSSMINSGEMSSKFSLTMEAYPDLKASTNMLQLQEEIVSTENKLSFAKQAYNDGIEQYNVTIESVPDTFVVKAFPKLKQDFKYWELSEEKVQANEERVVEF
ncbi:MAG: LemA protein [uncultured Campylobacterales bacterium]|uniref:LemA protein n=1 Tax=uncultured Campylobacterales bacterium TaxID=352960 RepID=A0A6S6TD52_9BACT|nr:MAG: LemA protein [uncultured Campylobacterales bacterium]